MLCLLKLNRCIVRCKTPCNHLLSLIRSESQSNQGLICTIFAKSFTLTFPSPLLSKCRNTIFRRSSSTCHFRFHPSGWRRPSRPACFSSLESWPSSLRRRMSTINFLALRSTRGSPRVDRRCGGGLLIYPRINRELQNAKKLIHSFTKSIKSVILTM